MSVGDLTAFLSYVLQVMNSLMLISNIFLMLTRSLASARRIREVLEEEPALTDPAQPVEEVPSGQVDFDGVSFQYSRDAEKPALSHVDLHIPRRLHRGHHRRQRAAPRAPWSSLSPGSMTPPRVRCGWGAGDVREYGLAALRDAVGIVLQKNVLFSGTVRENLKWGDPDADDETLWRACEIACADEFLRAMPRGWDTDLGQGGVNVSGGQKQRLCIARTLLKKPKVLIFDDSTSAVDTATEAKIRMALSALPDVTKIIIAQRLTSVMGADQIVVLEDGGVHAVGTHSQLLESDPIYQEIYHSQMRGGGDHADQAG